MSSPFRSREPAFYSRPARVRVTGARRSPSAHQQQPTPEHQPTGTQAPQSEPEVDSKKEDAAM